MSVKANKIAKSIGIAYALAVATLISVTATVKAAPPASGSGSSANQKGAGWQTGLDETANQAGYQPGEQGRNILASLQTVVHNLLGLMGVIFVLLTIYAGFLWMTAHGREDQVQKAKSILMDAVIGLIITLSAYTISDFVLKTAIEGAGIK